MTKKKLLFVCTANVSRSRTAEDLFINSEEYEAKSAGLKLHKDTKQLVTQGLIDWADVVIAMNETEKSDGRPPCQHLTKLRENFNLKNKEIEGAVIVFDIPDIYGRGDLRLINLLKNKLKKILRINI